MSAIINPNTHITFIGGGEDVYVKKFIKKLN